MGPLLAKAKRAPEQSHVILAEGRVAIVSSETPTADGPRGTPSRAAAAQSGRHDNDPEVGSWVMVNVQGKMQRDFDENLSLAK